MISDSTRAPAPLPDHTGRERQKNEVPRVAIIGAGPIGLESAIYARRLGMRVLLLEREAEVAPDVRAWAHVTMFTPWGENRSPLGEAVLSEPSSSGPIGPPLPSASLYPTGREFVDSYLLPLARSLGECLHLETRVVAVGRSYLFPDDYAETPERREARRFRLLTRSPLEERLFTADYIIDAAGVSHTPNWMGPGGMPAQGEMGSSRNVFYTIPDVLGQDRIHFLGKRTLLVGDGTSAATTALMLAEVQILEPSGSVVWATRTRSHLPLAYARPDRLPRRDLLLKKANLLVANGRSGFEHLPLTQVEAVQHSLGTGRFQVTLQVDRVTRRVAFDSVIANVGSRRDSPTFERALQPDETGYFSIGAKAAQEQQDFLLTTGRSQIRDAFRRITGDSLLDLYQEGDASEAYYGTHLDE